MNIKLKLSKSVSLKDIHEILNYLHTNKKMVVELYNMLYDTDDVVAFHAAWVMSHFPEEENKFLIKKQDELINELYICNHQGKKRLILTILCKQPLKYPPPLDLLDFCMEAIL